MPEISQNDLNAKSAKKSNWGMWTLRFILFCIIAGALLSSWIGPKFLAWFYEPPVELGVSCGRAVDWAMTKLLQTQLVGAIAGLVMSLFIVIAIIRRNQDRA